MIVYVYRMYNSKIAVSIVNAVERKSSYAVIFTDRFGYTKVHRIWKKSNIGKWDVSFQELPMIERDDLKAAQILLGRLDENEKQAQRDYDENMQSIKRIRNLVCTMNYEEIDGY